jgi:hypothetical protein
MWVGLAEHPWQFLVESEEMCSGARKGTITNYEDIASPWAECGLYGVSVGMDFSRDRHHFIARPPQV